MRAIVQDPRGWALASAIAIVLAVLARPAAAQGVVIQGDGTVNLGYSQTVQASTAPDNEARPDSVDKFYTELRPGILFQFGSQRLSWRAGYTFSGAFSLDSERSVAYSNTANVSLAAELTKYTTMNLSGSFGQGGTSFLLSQRAADTGQPDIRAPGNPSLVSVTLTESLAWEVGRQLTLRQSLLGSASAPEDDLGARNTAVTGTLGLDRAFTRDTAGLELRASASRLDPLLAGQGRYTSLANALLARWNHDFTWQWNGLATAGVEQVYTDTGNKPLAFLPTGSAAVRYTVGNAVASLDYTHATTTNLQVGSVALADRLTARGGFTFNAERARVLTFSAGYLHNEPIGEASAAVAAGTGDAVQGDAGFTTAITRDKKVLATARYSVAYQFGQDGGLAPTLIHVFIIGVTASYSNTGEVVRALPRRGQRVDGGDGEGFPVGDQSQKR
jgi:hypothetical protein